MSTDPRIEAAARGMFSHEQCDRRQKLDLESNWNGRLDDRDRREYRDLATAALAAVDKAETITTFTGVDSLPDGSVIIDKHGDVSQRRGDAWCSYETAPMPSRQIAKYLPARVIHWGTE